MCYNLYLHLYLHLYLYGMSVRDSYHPLSDGSTLVLVGATALFLYEIKLA